MLVKSDRRGKKPAQSVGAVEVARGEERRAPVRRRVGASGGFQNAAQQRRAAVLRAGVQRGAAARLV